MTQCFHENTIHIILSYDGFVSVMQTLDEKNKYIKNKSQ